MADAASGTGSYGFSYGGHSGYSGMFSFSVASPSTNKSALTGSDASLSHQGHGSHVYQQLHNQLKDPVVHKQIMNSIAAKQNQMIQGAYGNGQGIKQTTSSETAASHTSSSSMQQDARLVLERLYQLNGEDAKGIAPPVIVDKLKKVPLGDAWRTESTDSYASVGSRPTGQQFEKEVIRTILSKEVTMNKAEREKIARSLLTGNYEISGSTSGHGSRLGSPYSGSRPHSPGAAAAAQANASKNQASSYRIPPVDPISRTKEIARTKEKLLYLQRHNLPRQHFLEIMTETAPIPVVSGKELYEQKVGFLRNKGVDDTLTHVKLQPGLTWQNAIKRSPSPPDVRATRIGVNLEDSIDTLDAPAANGSRTIHLSDDTPAMTPATRGGRSTKPSRTGARQASPVEGGMKLTQSMPSLSGGLGGTTNDVNIKSVYAQLIKDEKIKRVQQTKEEILRKREQIKKKKEYDQLTVEKKTEVRKKIQAFRDQLREYLIKKRDPLAGEIMRTVDDSLIFYLLEKYDGFQLSPEAVIAMIQAQLGQSHIDPYPRGFDAEEFLEAAGVNNLLADAQAHHELAKEVLHGGGASVMSNYGGSYIGSHLDAFMTETRNQTAQSLSRQPPDHMALSMSLSPADKLLNADDIPIPMMAVHPHHSSLSAEKSYQSIVNNYKSFGQRSPPRSPSDTNRGIPVAPLGQVIPPYAQVPGYDYTRTGNDDPVVGYRLRPVEYDLRDSPPMKTLAGGFRVLPHSTSAGAFGHASGRAQSPTQHLESHYDRSPSPYRGERGIKEPLIVVSSEHLRTVMKEHGFNPLQPDRKKKSKGGTHGHGHTTHGHDDDEEEDGDRKGLGQPTEDDEIRSVQSMTSHHSLQSMTSALSQGSLSQHTQQVIAVMHQQLLEERILPSLEPERVLGDKHVEELGMHKKSFDEILDEVTGKKKVININSRASMTPIEPQPNYPADNGEHSYHHHGPLPTQMPITGREGGDEEKPTYCIADHLPLDEVDNHQPYIAGAAQSPPPPSQRPLTGKKSKSRTASMAAHQIMSMIDEEKRREELEKQIMMQRLKEQQAQRLGQRLIEIGAPLPQDDGVLSPNRLKALQLPLRGVVTSLKASIDAERLAMLSTMEKQKGEQRLILPALRPIHTDKYGEFIADFPGLEHEPKPFTPLDDEDRRNHERKQRQAAKELEVFDSMMSRANQSRPSSPGKAGGGGAGSPGKRGVKGPMAIKTQTKYEARDGMTGLPVTPFKSYAESMHVMNNGVPAGAGLMLWRPKETVSTTGRYRVGHQATSLQKSYNQTASGKAKPFVSAA